MSHDSPFKVRGVDITKRFSLNPFELLMVLRPTTGASHLIVARLLFCKGCRSNRTHWFKLRVNGSILNAWIDDVLAPESTLAFTAAISSCGSEHHSFEPAINLLLIVVITEIFCANLL